MNFIDLVKAREATVTPSFLVFNNSRESLPNANGSGDMDDIDNSYETLERYVFAVETNPHMFRETPEPSVRPIEDDDCDSVDSSPDPLDVGPSAMLVYPEECFARKALELFARTSTGGTDRDRISSGAAECAVCYERRANKAVLGCGHTFCFSCIEKAIETSNDKPVTKCFFCRSEPCSIIRVYG